MRDAIQRVRAETRLALALVAAFLLAMAAFHFMCAPETSGHVVQRGVAVPAETGP